MLKTLHKSVDIFVTDCRCLRADAKSLKRKKKQRLTNGRKNLRIHYIHSFSPYFAQLERTNEQFSIIV